MCKCKCRCKNEKEKERKNNSKINESKKAKEARNYTQALGELLKVCLYQEKMT